MSESRSKSDRGTLERFGLTITRIENRAKPDTTSHRGNRRRPGEYSAAVETAVVVTVIVPGVVVNVPFAETLAGLNLQAAPVGRFEQAREIVPLNPLELTTEKETVADPPGAETTADAPEAMDGKNPGVMVKVCGDVLLLGSKLASPL
jgi:hypothetical protein